MSKILFESQDYIVLDKSAGVSVHNDEESLIKQLQKSLSKEVFPVHRLDKETSGIQIMALNSNSARQLAEEFQKRSAVKIYRGVLRGRLEKPDGRWQDPLSDKAEGRRNPAGLSKDRVPCETKFKVLQRNKYMTSCEFEIVTGRQHQIRKHSALNRHPLVGDDRYNDPKYNKMIFERYQVNRLFLHCNKINIDGKDFVAEVPQEFEFLFKETT